MGLWRQVTARVRMAVKKGLSRRQYAGTKVEKKKQKMRRVGKKSVSGGRLRSRRERPHRCGEDIPLGQRAGRQHKVLRRAIASGQRRDTSTERQREKTTTVCRGSALVASGKKATIAEQPSLLQINVARGREMGEGDGLGRFGIADLRVDAKGVDEDIFCTLRKDRSARTIACGGFSMRSGFTDDAEVEGLAADRR